MHGALITTGLAAIVLLAGLASGMLPPEPTDYTATYRTCMEAVNTGDDAQAADCQTQLETIGGEFTCDYAGGRCKLTTEGN